MKKQLSFHDVEQLSAYLDGQTRQAERTRLDTRLKSEPELAAILEELRQARSLLRRTPRRGAPRNFTLTPKMAGIKPPIPRLVPAFSWASAVAFIIFICTLGTNVVGRLGFGAAAPMMAAESEYGVGGGPPAAEGMPIEATSAPASDNMVTVTVTPEVLIMAAPEATPAPEERAVPAIPAEQPKARTPVNPWLVIWPGLAVVLIAAALLVRWLSVHRFRKKSGKP